MSDDLANSSHAWGAAPWNISFAPQHRPLPEQVDFAIIGGGFTGLATACWLARLAPDARIAVLEAGKIGEGASGRTGGLALDATAAGALPGLGRVLDGFTAGLAELQIECDLELNGVWEIGREGGRADSPISWEDSGTLRVVSEVPGGMLDAGLLLSGLGRTAQQAGVSLHEDARVDALVVTDPPTLTLGRCQLRAHRVLVASGAWALALCDRSTRLMQTGFTVAAATEPLDLDQLRALGMAPGKPFYTLDLPYLWGRPLTSQRLLFGGGLVRLSDPQELSLVNVQSGKPARLLERLIARARGLHPAMASARFRLRWGGPVEFTSEGRPLFCRHPQNDHIFILAGYSGHGVALSIYLARWAAEALVLRRPLPEWGNPRW